MSVNNINNVPPREKRIITKYELEYGKIKIVHEIQIKDIDTDKFIVSERAMVFTGKTKAELISDLETERDNITATYQEKIDAIDAVE